MSDENAKLDREMLRHALFTGGLIAVAVLVRPGFIPWLVIAIAGVLFLLKQSWSARLIVVAALLVAFATVMMPWVFRNHKVTGALGVDVVVEWPRHFTTVLIPRLTEPVIWSSLTVKMSWARCLNMK